MKDPELFERNAIEWAAHNATGCSNMYFSNFTSLAHNHHTLPAIYAGLCLLACRRLYRVEQPYPTLGAFKCEQCNQDKEGPAYHCGVCFFDICLDCRHSSPAAAVASRAATASGGIDAACTERVHQAL